MRDVEESSPSTALGLKREEPPTPHPSAHAAVPLPTSEVTAPAKLTARMVEEARSATKRKPPGDTETARGLLNSAAAPRPSKLPETPGEPARVLVAPLGNCTALIKLLEVSDTKTVVLGA